ncbi:hypothetical protein SBA2_640027 [Acidobacteriia bacterium SbA2]|nr:hypothetical protein SBA2_640027 [Acidobacteriia bacterium SbA2]
MSRILDAPNHGDGAGCAELEDSEPVAGKPSTGTTRASQGGVGSGIQRVSQRAHAASKDYNAIAC